MKYFVSNNNYNNMQKEMKQNTYWQNQQSQFQILVQTLLTFKKYYDVVYGLLK